MIVDRAVMLTPKMCHVFEATLTRAVDNARKAGNPVPHEAITVLGDIRRLALEYRLMPQDERSATDATDDNVSGHTDVSPRGAMLTTDDLSGRLGVTAGGVRDLLRRGRIPGHHSGGRWLVWEVDLKEYLREREEKRSA